MSRRRNTKTAGHLPLMTLLIEALEEQASHDRPDEAKALRAFGELALKQVPTRGVFSPADGELYAAIDLIAKKHLGLTTPRKNFFAATAKVEPFALRDEIESAANHLMTVSESGVLLRRTGIWGNAGRVLRPALAPPSDDASGASN